MYNQCISNKVTGNKLEDKMYYKHTGYVGNMKKENLSKKLERKPEEVILLAIKRMLPKNKLANTQLNRLRIFKNEDYPHNVQKPIKVNLN
jgi:large subunit ribosomal protein L13